MRGTVAVQSGEAFGHSRYLDVKERSMPSILCGMEFFLGMDELFVILLFFFSMPILHRVLQRSTPAASTIY